MIKDIELIKEQFIINEDGTVIDISNNRIVPQGNAGGGYKYVSLKKFKSRSVHQLVASVFIPNPEGKPHVNHKDLNKSNNHVSNLEWVTPKENMVHFGKNKVKKKKPKMAYFALPIKYLDRLRKNKKDTGVLMVAFICQAIDEKLNRQKVDE